MKNQRLISLGAFSLISFGHDHDALNSLDVFPTITAT